LRRDSKHLDKFLQETYAANRIQEHSRPDGESES
jgi:hypothetical protein